MQEYNNDTVWKTGIFSIQKRINCTKYIYFKKLTRTTHLNTWFPQVNHQSIRSLCVIIYHFTQSTELRFPSDEIAAQIRRFDTVVAHEVPITNGQSVKVLCGSSAIVAATNQEWAMTVTGLREESLSFLSLDVTKKPTVNAEMSII